MSCKENILRNGICTKEAALLGTMEAVDRGYQPRFVQSNFYKGQVDLHRKNIRKQRRRKKTEGHIGWEVGVSEDKPKPSYSE